MAKSKRKRHRGRRKRGDGRGAPERPAPRQLTEGEREIEAALDEITRRAAEAHAPETRPERVAEILVDDFEDMPAPVGFAETLVEQGIERARAVAAQVDRLAPGSLVALTLAAELAREADGDSKRSAALLEEACEVWSEGDTDGAGPFAMHLLNGGLALEALEMAEDCMSEDPADEIAQEVQAAVLEQLHQSLGSGARLDRAQRQALERFGDRGGMYELREQMGEFVETRPQLQERIAVTIGEWLATLGEDGETLLDELAEPGGGSGSGLTAGVISLAVERAWLREQDDDEDDLDQGELLEDEAELEEPGVDDTSALAQLATDHATSLAISDAAAMWLDTCTYGLWQVADPTSRPGVWLTDILSGVRRYAAIPPEQLEQASRWSVLMGALVSIDGVWRTTAAVVPLRPAEADGAAELVRSATDDLIRALTGKRPRRDARRRRQPQPYGVLVDEDEEASPVLADLISKVVCNLLPTIASEVSARRAAGPRLANTDGHPTKLITAHVKVGDPAVAADRLAAHPDFRREDDELTWWGRELTASEQASTRAQLRAQFGGEEPPDPDETPRWLRGRLKPERAGFEVDVNSEERLEMLLEVLRGLGLEPDVTRRSAVDPALDLPPIPLGGPMPFGASQQAIEAWLEYWPGERIPALGQLTPRIAARRNDKRPYLEAVLREFEHDAYLLERAGRPAPDIARLRSELGMESWRQR